MSSARANRYSMCSVQATSVTFVECVGFRDGLEGMGGAAFIEYSQLYAKSVSTSGCYAQGGGSFALVSSLASFDECTFTKSRARNNGGAIMFTTYSNSNPTKEDADHPGISYADGNANFGITEFFLGFFKCSFNTCTCGISGGAISVTGCPELFIELGHFANCASGKMGGAASLTYCQSSIRRSLFFQCSCGGRGETHLAGVDALGSGSSVTRNSYGVHLTKYRDVSHNSGGGAIFCRQRFRSTPADASSTSPCLITESCCFIHNQCRLPANSRYQSGGLGFDINLNNSYYLSYRDRFWTHEALSIVANMESYASSSAEPVTRYGTRFYGNVEKFISDNTGCARDWNVAAFISQAPATAFAADTDDYATTMVTEGADVDVETSQPAQTKQQQTWAPHPTDKGRTNVQTIARFGLTVTDRTAITKLYLGPTSVFTHSSMFTESNQFQKSADFSNSELLAKSSDFTGSNAWTPSNAFSLTRAFTESSVMSVSSDFTVTAAFTISTDFRNSGEFSKSLALAKSLAFTLSSVHSESVVFTISSWHTVSDDFSESVVFSVSDMFSSSDQFAESKAFSGSSILSKSEGFTLTQAFTVTSACTESSVFTQSKHFSASGVFSVSDSFTPWMTRTPIEAFQEISETAVALSSLTLMETVSASFLYQESQITYIETCIDGTCFVMSTVTGGGYTMVYGTIVIPVYVITYSQAELILVRKDEPLLNMSMTTLIGLVSGGSLVIAMIAIMIGSFIKRAREGEMSSEVSYDDDDELSDFNPEGDDHVSVVMFDGAWDGDEKDDRDDFIDDW